MRSSVCGKAFACLKKFLGVRSFYVEFGGVVSSPRAVSQAVTQVSVLSPLLFHNTLAALPEYIPVFGFPTVRIVMYADDIILRCIVSYHRTYSVRSRLQWNLGKIVSFLREIVLILSSSKAAQLVDRFNRRLPPMCAKIYICGQPVPKVNTYPYLGLLIDDRVASQLSR